VARGQLREGAGGVGELIDRRQVEVEVVTFECGFGLQLEHAVTEAVLADERVAVNRCRAGANTL
jgi:hypothetical protein